MDSTIYALSTPFAKSAIAIIRVSGNSAKDSLYKLSGLRNPIPFKSNLVTLKNLNNEIIDKPLIIYFPKKNSYTGEDLVEYHIHGSIAVIKELMDILSKFNDHRLAYNGEFTKRALENNKMNLIEVEGLHDLIESETLLQKKYALEAMNGNAYKIYQKWLNIIKDNLSLLEASIDFSDEDLPKDITLNIDKDINVLFNDIQLELNKFSGISKIKNGLNIVIIGSPNVGKSTLINYLAKDDVSITSNIPGTTRDTISISLEFGGFPIIITDTAGIRQTIDKIEKLGINKAIEKSKLADLKLVIIDATKFFIDFPLIEQYVNKNDFIIINKIDLINDNEMKSINKYLIDKNIKGFFISLKLNKGLNFLIESLKNILNEINSYVENPVIVNERHKSTIENLKSNIIEFNNEKDIVLRSYYLRNAMNTLGKVLGLNNIEDILDNIFSKFCIGK